MDFKTKEVIVDKSKFLKFWQSELNPSLISLGIRPEERNILEKMFECTYSQGVLNTLNDELEGWKKLKPKK